MRRSEWEREANGEWSVCDITAHDVRRDLRRLVRLTPVDPARATLVDLGCGTGTFIAQHGTGFQRIVGVDFSASVLARAARQCGHLPDVQWTRADIGHAARSLANHADLTVCFNVVTSPHRSRRSQILRAMAAITRPGGYSLVVVPSAEFVLAAGLGYRSKPESGGGVLIEREGAWQKYFTRAELRADLEAAGYTVRRLRRVHYPWSEEVDGRARRGVELPWDWGCLAELAGEREQAVAS